jgi:tRNA threonylcarbamoyladenosine biosynthesis protein TsaE
MKYISKSLEETKEIAQNFLNTLKPQERATVIALQGDLGAGKTAFSQMVGKLLGVEENMQSPTFVIMKIYKLKPTTSPRHGGASNQQLWSNLIHIDAYRLEKEEELLHLGWQEIISEPENLVLIEWPENVSGIIPSDTRRVDFKFVDESTREISYEN